MSLNRLGLRRLHRWLGLALLLPLLLLLITGILLNHTEALRLDEHHAGSWLIELYDIRPQPPETGYKIGESWISHARGKLFLDAQPIDDMTAPPRGAMRWNEVLIVASTGGVSLYTAEGRTVDSIDLPVEAKPAKRLAVTDNGPVLYTTAGAYALNASMTEWVRDPEIRPAEVKAQSLPRELRDAIAHHLSATTLSWERVLLDLHAGRLFGRLGPWLMDVTAAVVAVLATTGCLIWLRATGIRRRRHRR